MTYAMACGDPPLYPFVDVVSTGIGTAWNTPVWNFPIQTIQIVPSTVIGGGYYEPYGPSPLDPIQKNLMDQEKIKKLMEYLQSQPQTGNPFESLPPNLFQPAIEAAPAPKEEPEPPQDLTRPFQRKLDLD